MFSYTTRPKYFFFLNDAKTDDSHIGIYNYVLCKLSCIPTHALSMKYFIRAPICGRPIVINLFVRPSVRPSIHLSARSLVRSIPSLPLAKSGCNFTHKYCLWVKGMQWHWTKILDLRLKSAELFKESFHIQDHMFSLGAIWLILHLQDTFGWRVCSNLVCSF